MRDYTMAVMASCLLLSPVVTSAQCGQLVWSDEFNGNSLDETSWSYREGNGCPNNCGYGNAELQSYERNNITFEDGKMVITANNNNGAYTSGSVWTKGKKNWRYGRFEMRAKLSNGTGAWPAFWMLPESSNWPTTGEIDIMEQRGDWPGHIGGTLHYGPSYPANQHDGTGYDLPDGRSFNNEWHTFAVEWEQGEIRWYVDDELFKTETQNPNSLDPASGADPWPWNDGDWFIILNLAVGGENTWYTGRQAPNIGSSTTYEIDYVRVYSAGIPQVDIEGPERIFEDETAGYNITTETGWSLDWIGSDELSLSGNNGGASANFTGTDIGSTELTLEVTHGQGSPCPGEVFTYTKAVDVLPNNCGLLIEDYDDVSYMDVGYVSGAYYKADNPSASGINTSNKVGYYQRDGGTQYDMLVFENVPFQHGDNLKSGDIGFTMDVYTGAAIGTSIEIQIANSALNSGWPTGIHSLFSATTTVQNQWETLDFSFVQHPDGNHNNFADDLNKLIILVNPDSYTDPTLYFDNFRLTTPGLPELEITGKIDLDSEESGVTYVATGISGATAYDWEVPKDASINGTATGSTVSVDFGQSGGLVSARAMTDLGCYSQPGELPVIVGGNACSLFGDEYELGTGEDWISSLDPEISGFTYLEDDGVMTITSAGHDQWAGIKIDINDGSSSSVLDFSDPENDPQLQFKAKASEPVHIAVTLVDINGRSAQNQWLAPLNGLVLNEEWQEFNIDFNGQMWDEWVSPGVLDTTAIDYIRIGLNPGFASKYPPSNGNGGTFTDAFVGTLNIDYIRIGADCGSSEIEGSADFESSTDVACIDESVSFESVESALAANHTLEWNFGSNATPQTASGLGPHEVTYSDQGSPVVTTALKKNGVTVDESELTIMVNCDAIGVEERSNRQLHLYPNPSQNGWQYIPTSNGQINLMTVHGQLLSTQTVQKGQLLQLGSSLAPGTYIIQFMDGQSTYNQRLIKVAAR